MKTGGSNRIRFEKAFTASEFFAVVFLLFVLAALLLPVGGPPRKRSPIGEARTEVHALANGVEAYQSAYGHFPVSPEVQDWAKTAGGDVTFGGEFSNGSVPPHLGTLMPDRRRLNNAEVIAVVMDLTNYPSGGPTINTNHGLNPRQTKFLNAKFSHPVNAGAKPLPGVDKNGVYRDPWGNPYILTVDLNGDGLVDDVLYGEAGVSQYSQGVDHYSVGLNGLVRTNTDTGSSNRFRFPGRVMVWSGGPDGKFDSRLPANVGVNKDNVVSWH